MKILILLFVLLSASNVFSQVTLTSNNNPTAGNTQMITDCDTNGVSQGNPGANQTWTFTNLSRGDSVLFNWVLSSSTPYSSQFPASNVASTFDNSFYSFFTTTGTNLTVNGYAGPSSVIPYSDPELYMQYPFTYNSSFNDNFAASYDVGGITTIRTGTINVTGDAWGTINLPNGSFANALRVKYIISTKDSSNPGFPIVTLTDNMSFVWFVPGKKFPVFEIVYSTIRFNGTVQASSKTVNYNSGNTPIGIKPISTGIANGYKLEQNYPNPFNPSTNINFSVPANSGNVRIYITDITGREIAEVINENKLTAGSYSINYDAGNLAAGIYFYTLETKNFIETKKMILLK
ncbi:MAG: T9SS C-terminal target domain-containing protein [Ignavibacteriae bacterium]|nr:MAG: T9SS C-terminal target domain-containing protein [Ignavibacteriota bacterium]